MDEEKLICLVQKYKEIYDLSDGAYHNQQQKDNVWEEIAGELNRPISECKKRWSTLRDSYRKSIKAQETRSGEAATKKKSWRYDKQMSFLRPFVADRQQISSVTHSDSSETETQQPEENSHIDDVASPVSILSPSTSRPCSSASNKSDMAAQKRTYTQKKQNTLSSAQVLQDYLTEKSTRRKSTCETQKSLDPITKFFDCMAETTKTFPPELQIEVKGKIFAIVSDAEIKNMNFSPITLPNSQQANFAHQHSQSTHFQQQNQITIPQPLFQQQQHQLPYSQLQTHHPSVIPHTLSLQTHEHVVSPYPLYSQQRTPASTHIPPPSIDYHEDVIFNNDDNDIAGV